MIRQTWGVAAGRAVLLALALYGAWDLAGAALAQYDQHVYMPYNRQPTGADPELEARVARLEALLAPVSRDGDDLVITGANLRIVSGSGKTDGVPNGRGNLIIGYNERRGGFDETGQPEDVRSGSHMLVIGKGHNYSRFGGLMVGTFHNATGEWSSVIGGTQNTASGIHSLVAGGSQNSATGGGATTCGGGQNRAGGWRSTVSGGEENSALADGSSVTGGQENRVVGNGEWGTVTGGRGNQVTGQAAAVSGGAGITEDRLQGWSAGTLRSP